MSICDANSSLFSAFCLQEKKQRNKERTRTLPEKAVAEMWSQVQKNIGGFQQLFGSRNFIIVDNNDAGEDIFAKVFKRIRGIIVRKPSKPQAKQWIANELKKKDRR